MSSRRGSPHYVVVTRYSGNTFYINDPGGDNKSTLDGYSYNGTLILYHGTVPKTNPGKPSITSPTQNQVLTSRTFNVVIQQGTLNYTGLYNFRFEIASDSGFSHIVRAWKWEANGVNTFSVTLPSDGTYYVHASQGDTVGMESGWGSTRTFQVGQGPSAPSIQSPADGLVTSSTQNLQVSLTRGALSGRPGEVTSYEIKIDNDPTFASVNYDSGWVSSATITLNQALADAVWYVRAYQSDGVTTSPVSGTTMFIVNALPLTQVYSNDFTTAVGFEWSNGTETVSPNGTRRFLGEFGNDTTTLTLGGLPAHTFVYVTLDLLMLKSMDGNLPNGPDLWTFSAGGNPILQTTFANGAGHRQAYPGAYPSGDYDWRTGSYAYNQLGYSADTVYRLGFRIAHGAGPLVLSFAGSNQQGISDESWGIDDLHVYVNSSVADLSVTQTHQPEPVTAGGSIALTVSVSNAGPFAASAVSLTDTLPAGLTPTSITPSQGSCSPVSGGQFTCSLGVLSANSTAQIAVLLPTALTTSGTLTNRVTATSSEFDSNTDNNTSTHSLTVVERTQCQMADVNGDGTVDLSDVQSAAGSFGIGQGDALYDPYKDVNLDGTIDISDIRKIARQLGQSCH